MYFLLDFELRKEDIASTLILFFQHFQVILEEA